MARLHMRYLAPITLLLLGTAAVLSRGLTLQRSPSAHAAGDVVAMAAQPSWDGAHGGNFGYVDGLDTAGSFVLYLSAAPGYYDGPPAWSPDGTLLAFAETTFDSVTNTNAAVLHIVRSDGAPVADLHESSVDRAISWDPSSTSVAYGADLDRSTGLYDVVVYDTRSATRTDLTSLTGYGVSPRPGPVSSDIAWSSAGTIGWECGGSDIYTGAMFCFAAGDGSGFKRVSSGFYGPSTGPVWNPNGTLYAVAATCLAACGGTLAVVDAFDGHWVASVQLSDSGYTNSDLAWSPDGTKLLATGPPATVFTFDGQSLVPTVQALMPAFISAQAWSSSGEDVAISNTPYGPPNGTSILSSSTLAPVIGPLNSGVIAFRPVPPTPAPSPTPTDTPTATATAVPPVVVLVHGIDFTHTGDANCGMSGAGSRPDLVSMETFINNPTAMAGHQFNTECLGATDSYLTRKGVAAGAHALANLIERVKQQRHVSQVDIVAHSMGGLVARYYIERLNGRGNVRSLTMLGTPNLGSTMAIPVCAFWSQWWAIMIGQYDQGGCDMVPGSPLVAYLNVLPGSHSGVSYDVLTGWEGLNPGELLPNDCIVSVLSASEAGLLPTELFPGSISQPRVLHVTGSGASGVGSGIIGCGTNGNGETEDPGVQARVAQILLASNGFAPAAIPAAIRGASGGVVAAAATDTPAPADTSTGTPTDTPTDTPTATATATVTPIPTAPAASTIASQSGLIAASATADVPVPMPASQASGTFIFRAPADPSASLTFTLLRPDGTPVATTDADVTYETGAGFGGLTQTDYTIANPAAGTWTMRVTGTVVPVTGWPYDMQALVPGGISVIAGAGAGHYDVGTAIDLSADVAVNATPYAGATVNATITKPDSSTAVVALTDAGGGSYTGSFGDTSACGMYQITVTASGSDNGTPFTRLDRTVAVVGVPGNVILDPCVADHTGDGYTDAQKIALGKDPTAYCNIMRADVNMDGTVNGIDLNQLAKYFTQTVPPAPARVDQNADNVINGIDLNRLAGVFTQSVSACP